jgi:hypothetical protein
MIDQNLSHYRIIEKLAEEVTGDCSSQTGSGSGETGC